MLMPLDQLTPAALEEWLFQRLSAVYGADAEARIAALDLSDFGISSPDSLLDGLGALFARLTRHAQINFKIAVEGLLRHARPEYFPAEGMVDLVFLIGLTGANGALAALEPVIGAGIWGEVSPDLFFSALAVLKGLRHGHEAYAAAKSLVSCSLFPPQYAFDAYEVLLGARPDQWAVDFLEMEPLFDLLSADHSPENRQHLSERYDSLVEEVLHRVSLGHIATGFGLLTVVGSQLSASTPRGRLIGRLCQGATEGGIRLSPTKGISVFRRSTNLERPIVLSSDASEVYILHRIPRAIPFEIQERDPRATSLKLANIIMTSVNAPTTRIMQAGPAG
jgi:hypothetical protein